MLDVGAASHALPVQTACVMESIEPLLEGKCPDLAIVPVDANSTPAAAAMAVKLGIPTARLAADMRCFDRTIPTDIRRTAADQFSEHLSSHSDEAIGDVSCVSPNGTELP